MNVTLPNPVAGLAGESVVVWRDKNAIVLEIMSGDESAEAYLAPLAVCRMIEMLQGMLS